MKKGVIGFLFLLVGAGITIAFFLARPSSHHDPVIPHIGQIQVLNACSVNGAARELSDFLRSRGFDVVEFANNDEWYFENTIVACRNRNMKIGEAVAGALGTDRLLLLRKEGVLLDATVFVGKDYKRLLEKS